MPKQIQCPFCSGSVVPKFIAKPFNTVNGMLQRNFGIRIPSAAIGQLITSLAPVKVSSILKQACSACGSGDMITDPSDDSEKHDNAAQIAKSTADERKKNENLLSPPCGNRYTVIQGCDLLEVGLGMNTSPSYRVDKDKGIRNSRLLDPSEVDTKKAGPVSPVGAKANHVQGINPISTPGGHYVIKCSNKFSVVVGAQGIDITTGGPVNIHGGITTITGPEVTVGSKTGRLVLEGDVVNINGKSIEVAPTDGHLFVKGNISNTGNIVSGGHLHAESVSVVHMQMTGKNERTTFGAPSDTMTGPAFYGGIAMQALPQLIKDQTSHTIQNAADPLFGQELMSIRGITSLSEKIINLAKAVIPYEILPTGYIIPGTTISIVGTCPCNYGGIAAGTITGVTTAPILLHNFPHIHALPDLRHNHEVRVPDIDCTADSSADVRNNVAGVSKSSAPLHVEKSQQTGVLQGLFGSIGSVLAGTRAITQNNVFSQKI